MGRAGRELSGLDLRPFEGLWKRSLHIRIRDSVHDRQFDSKNAKTIHCAIAAYGSRLPCASMLRNVYGVRENTG